MHALKLLPADAARLRSAPDSERACAQLSIIMYTSAMPGSSSHATGRPGSLDHLAYAYAALMFFSGLVHTWAWPNNIAIMSEVRALRKRRLHLVVTVQCTFVSSASGWPTGCPCVCLPVSSHAIVT